MPNMPDAMLLCGGAGLRLRDITGSGPKSMATVAGRPFLEVLLKQLRRSGFERAVLAVGCQKTRFAPTLGSKRNWRTRPNHRLSDWWFAPIDGRNDCGSVHWITTVDWCALKRNKILSV